LAWLETVDSTRWLLTVSDSPTVVSHPYLREERLLAEGDLTAFDVEAATRADGPLHDAHLADSGRSALASHLSAVDRRADRVLAQQYLRLSVARQDISYEMCGARATVALSGRDLRGATTPAATLPIRRRLKAWVVLVALLSTSLVLLRESVTGVSAYFANARTITGALVATAVAISIPAFGAFLRSWRGGLRFWRVGAVPAVGLTTVAIVTLGIGVVGLLSRPSGSEVTAALAAGDLARARQVTVALEETNASPAVMNLDDQVTLAEAGKATGEARLTLLDRVAGRNGPAASTATAAARTDRLTAIRKLADSRDTKTALVTLDRDFPGAKGSDSLVLEERAHAYDVAEAACTTTPCQFASAVAANSSHPTPARQSVVQAVRTALIAALDHSHVSAKDMLPRLQQLRTLRDLADETLTAPQLDDALATAAKTTSAWTTAERAKVPLLWSDPSVVDELLAERAGPATSADSVRLEGATVFPAFASNHKCSGLYVIGSADSLRSYSSTSWPPERLLSQAVGKPATIHKPANDNVTTTNWYESGFLVVARWRAGSLVELRIGDANP
jgi:hypothetical protein